MEATIIFAFIFGLIFFCVVVFIICAVLFPEWVGISGRSHNRVIEEQQTSSQGDSTSGEAASPDVTTGSPKSSSSSDGATESES